MVRRTGRFLRGSPAALDITVAPTRHGCRRSHLLFTPSSSAFVHIVVPGNSSVVALFSLCIEDPLQNGGLCRWNGDVVGPLARWHGLTRYIDTTFLKVGAPGKTIKNIPTGPGDWVPPPNSPDNPDFKAQDKVNGAFSAGFSFIRDVGHVRAIS
jgi:hypothetical protein